MVVCGNYKNLNKITKKHIALKFNRLLIFVILKIEGLAVEKKCNNTERSKAIFVRGNLKKYDLNSKCTQF